MSVPTFPSPLVAMNSEEFLEGVRGVRIYWQYVPPGALALVAVVHGGGDHSGRHARARRGAPEPLE